MKMGNVGRRALHSAPASRTYFDQTAMDAAWAQASINMTNEGIDVAAALAQVGERVSMTALTGPDVEHPIDEV